MSIRTRLGAALCAALAAVVLTVMAPSAANAQVNRSQTSNLAVAGSPLIIPAKYLTGVVTALDERARTITVAGETYTLGRSQLRDIHVGDEVTVAWIFEHYGPAAKRVAVGVTQRDL
jgi:hypothetical protein